jgi:hypothetical protein
MATAADTSHRRTSFRPTDMPGRRQRGLSIVDRAQCHPRSTNKKDGSYRRRTSELQEQRRWKIKEYSGVHATEPDRVQGIAESLRRSPNRGTGRSAPRVRPLLGLSPGPDAFDMTQPSREARHSLEPDSRVWRADASNLPA